MVFSSSLAQGLWMQKVSFSQAGEFFPGGGQRGPRRPFQTPWGPTTGRGHRGHLRLSSQLYCQLTRGQGRALFTLNLRVLISSVGASLPEEGTIGMKVFCELQE